MKIILTLFLIAQASYLFGQELPVGSAKKNPPSDCYQVFTLNKINNRLRDQDGKYLTYVLSEPQVKASYRSGRKQLMLDLNSLLNEKPFKETNVKLNTVAVSFLVDSKARFGRMNTQETENSIDSLLVEKLKKLSCNWIAANYNGRAVSSSLKYGFVYEYKWAGGSKHIENLRMQIKEILILEVEQVLKRPD
ncbi:hypothetical protein [Sphingobacterium hungaricum]|uniref:Uncharacterized protein n=1 Tax=Sphingobacterium hungaricum TaxID=2082723 RepID=A0A928UXC9_9SPHI|nr:hypothetical protein [Sphingobacterium hungaricum]MBE8712309.1 hypothetical protein [Sphingobacterium hungaricum]